ncbi:peptidase U32 family protein [Noviherbaspirillum aerium]|uniref:peptidase U32 family protein n=1 Tax=Noviherbaspirillum aerium TaxID=2588497 RepID=UPI00124EF755|nr:U32 family peptidase [Noviherbaspirillum aerium]
MARTSAQVLFIRKASEPVVEKLELVCQAPNMTSLKAAIDNGANSIKIDCSPITPRTHSGFSLLHDAALRKGIRYAHEHEAKIIFSFAPLKSDATSWARSISIIRDASSLGIDAIALSDPALMLYTAAHYPKLAIHYLVPPSIVEPGAIKHMQRSIPISRLILPPVVSVAQIKEITTELKIDVELVGYGRGSAILAPQSKFYKAGNAGYRRLTTQERRHDLTTSSATHCGAIERCATADEATNDYIFQHACAEQWNVLRVLPQLTAIHVRALRIELQDHSPAKIARFTRIWRTAIDECSQDTEHYNVRPAWLVELKQLASPI